MLCYGWYTFPVLHLPHLVVVAQHPDEALDVGLDDIAWIRVLKFLLVVPIAPARLAKSDLTKIV